MALRIFDTDPDAKPKERDTKREYERPVFQFRSGMQVWNKSKRRNDPVSLANWRVLTDDPVIADSIAELLGGKSEEYDATKAMNLHVLTDTPSVEIVINGSKAIEDKLILWGQGGPAHECDGEFSLLPDDRGEPCGCPRTMVERKELARKRPPKGPSPSINVTFRLAGLGYDLGPGKMIATAWSLAEVIHEVKDALDQVEGEALCRLTIEHVEYIDKATQEKREFRKPVIEVLGSYADAIAEER
ncbi:recombination directionality factor [Streptomyces mirabilis]